MFSHINLQIDEMVKFDDCISAYFKMLHRKTIFGDVRETHVVFCLDSSGSSYKVWELLCTHLVEHLCNMAEVNPKSTFNVIAFDTQVMLMHLRSWCTPLHVQIRQFRTKPTRINRSMLVTLKRWMEGICHGGGMYLLPALLSAFSSVSTECVYVVGDLLSIHVCSKLSYILVAI